jgi:hypothetical protein
VNNTPRQGTLPDATWKRIQSALEKLSGAIAEHRAALEAERLLVDPQDLAAMHLLSCGALYLPDSPRMTKAAGAAGFTAKGKGPSEIDDNRALLELARLVRSGEQLKPASRKAARLAPGASSESADAARLRRKFREHKKFYILMAEDAFNSGASLESVADRLRKSLAPTRRFVWREYLHVSSRPGRAGTRKRGI